MKIKVWNDEEAKVQLSKRIRSSKDARNAIEQNWINSEQTVFTSLGNTRSLTSSVIGDLSSVYGTGQEEINNSDVESNISYAFKNLRFIHAQLSANPPSVVVRPTSSDPEDRLKADAADRLVRHAIRTYSMQERQDACSLQCLTYGSGFIKQIFNGSKGDVLDVTEDGQLIMEGDIDITVPSTWDIFIDPDAECWNDVRFVFQRIFMNYEDAISTWPAHTEYFEKIHRDATNAYGGRGYKPDNQNSDLVEIWQYWEKGLPINGYLGRYVHCLENGTPLEPIKPNPHRFVAAETVRRLREKGLKGERLREKLAKIPQIAELPFHIFTDIDIPNQVYGKSFIEYVTHLQDNMNRLDMMVLDNVRAHGSARMVLPEGSEIADDSITDSTWDVIKISGAQPPHFVNPPSPMQDLSPLRDRMKMGIDDISGVNDTLFGQMQRETSGSALQYATNQGNMIRRRLFNKYVLLIESVYKTYLKLIRKHWETGRVIQVVGREKIAEAVEIKGADIDGGFDMQVEYGASLSLDPQTRRTEILTMQPLFEKAGVPARIQLQMMKLNELEGMHDIIQMAEDRQKEIFDVMIATGEYYPPKKFQDHKNMIAWALNYFMTREFNDLDEDTQDLCRAHIEERMELAGSEVQPPVSIPPAGGGVPPTGTPPAGPAI